jgi:hypothetical protein
MQLPPPPSLIGGVPDFVDALIGMDLWLLWCQQWMRKLGSKRMQLQEEQ